MEKYKYNLKSSDEKEKSRIWLERLKVKGASKCTVNGYLICLKSSCYNFGGLQDHKSDLDSFALAEQSKFFFSQKGKR